MISYNNIILYRNKIKTYSTTIKKNNCIFAKKYNQTMKRIGFFYITFFLCETVYSQAASDTLFTNDTILINDTITAKDSTLSEEIKTNPFLQDSIATDSMSRVIQILLSDTVPTPSKVSAADSLRSGSKNIVKIHPAIIRFNRFLREYREERNEWDERWNDIYLPAPNIRPNADYYKLSMPATYYSAPIEQAMSIRGWVPTIPFIKEKHESDSLFQAPHITVSADIDRNINKQLLSFYLNYPYLVEKNEIQFKDLEPLSEKLKIKKPKKEYVYGVLTLPTSEKGVKEQDLSVIKPNFWKITGKADVQFSQNYVSDNWYNGGESVKTLLGNLLWQFNYDDRQKIQFENKIEWKLGFVTTPSDTVHKFKPNNDMVRLSSKLGYRAIYNWYYTLSGEFKTQIVPNYDTNSDNLIASLFSPAELNVGLGMDYKYIKEEVCNLSVLINPFNYTRYSVASRRVDPTKYNVEAGKRVKNQLGSRLEVTLNYKILSNLTWDSKLSYTTNYEKVLSDWENTFTFVFNRFFSTKLFVHTRFDDSVTRKEGESYFQLQELLSLGFNYAW